jgi:hypothetical protein
MYDYPKFTDRKQVDDELKELDQERRDAIIKDLVDAIQDSDLKIFDYYNRIGKGNLRGYADCLLVQNKRNAR